MSFEYIEITDPEFNAAKVQFEQSDYVLVKPKDYSKVPLNRQEWSPKSCLLSDKFKRLDEKVKNLEVRHDDIWVISYPKSGTTWTQEMVWCICNNLDYKQAETRLGIRFPFLEIGGIRDLPDDMDPYQTVLDMKSPRFIKTHLPISFLPDQIWTIKPKIVYVRRNPKDVAVSYFHHSVMLHEYQGTKETFMKDFMKDLQLYSPIHEHVLEYYQLRNMENFLFLSFEDMKKDLKAVVNKTCDFFGHKYTEEQIQGLCKHLSFESMKSFLFLSLSQILSAICSNIAHTVKSATLTQKR